MLLDHKWITLEQQQEMLQAWLEQQREIMQTAQMRTPAIPGPDAAAQAWLEQQQREIMQTAQMRRLAIPRPPPGVGPDDGEAPPPPPQRVVGHVPPLLPPPQRVVGHVPQVIERLKSEIAALTVEIELQNSEVTGLVREMERMAVQINELTVQNAEVIDRLTAVEHRDTAAAAGRQTGVPSQSGGDITRRKAYVSSSNEGFLECTRPGPDSSEQPENQASAG